MTCQVETTAEGLAVPISESKSLLPFFFFFTLVTGPRRSLSLNLSDTRVYEPPIRARFALDHVTADTFFRKSLSPQIA